MTTSYRERDYAYGAAMLKLRTAIGLTQGRLGNLVGVSWRAVAEWEAGSSYPKTERLKALIELAVQYRAFTAGQEAEEIRALWKIACQKALLDELWLCALLSQRSSPRPKVEPKAVEETRGSVPPPLPDIETETEASPIPTEPDLTQPLQTNATQPQRSLVVESETGASPTPTASAHTPDKARERHKWLLANLISLIIITLIGSAGTLFFLVRDGTPALMQADKAATAQAYPGYLSGNGTLVLFDALNQEGAWPTVRDDNTGGSCRFTGGAYHISEQQSNYFSNCSPNGTFSNFAFEVQLTITQGDCGGMTFRDQGSDVGRYFFSICQNGTYQIRKYAKASDFSLMRFSYSSAIHAGLDQQNKIALVASGNTMTFYVNEQQIDQMQDSSYTSGHVGLIAAPYTGNSHTTEVAYNNAKLWTL